MLNRLKFTNKKILAIFIVLLITNICFYYIYISSLNINLYTIEILQDLSLLVSSIIIFAFISTKLPKLRRLGDSSLYDVAYFIIWALLMLFISYYNATINRYVVLGSFLDMFNVLAVSLIFMIVATHFNIFKEIIVGKHSKKNLIYCMVIFSILGIIASLSLASYDSLANVRTMTILIGSMFGGPIVGIPSAIIAGLFRLSMGGTTAVPCALSTIICGFIGSAIHILNGKRFLNSVKSAILMFLVIGFEMLLIILMVDSNLSIPIVKNIYPPMLFASVVGIILFKMAIKDNEESVKEKPKSEIEELKEKLKEQEKRIDDLENELKNK